MGIYLLLFLIVSVFLMIESSADYIKIGTLRVKTRTISFGIIFISIIFLGIFKGEGYGYDADSYQIYYFDYLKHVSLGEALHSGIEPGFALVSFLICRLTTHFWVYRAVLFLFTFGGLSKIIWDKSKNVSLSFLLFISLGLLSFDMFILRQAFAVTVIFLGYGFLEKGKYIKFSLFILTAATFHYTALLVFALLPLTSRNFTNTYIFKKTAYISGAIIVGMFFLPELIQMYTINDYSGYTVSGEGYGLLLLLSAFFLVISIFRHNCTGAKKSQSYDTVYEYSFGSIYIQIVALFFSLFNRTIYYALIYSLINISDIASVVNKRTQKTFMFIITIFMAVMYYMTILNATELIPYVSVFDG